MSTHRAVNNNHTVQIQSIFSYCSTAKIQTPLEIVCGKPIYNSLYTAYVTVSVSKQMQEKTICSYFHIGVVGIKYNSCLRNIKYHCEH